MPSLEGPSDGYPINVPTIRTWELTSNSTRYDHITAAPTDEERILMWSLWAVIAGLSIIVIFIVFVGILSNSRIRQSPFNQFLLWLMVPDIFYTGLCTITCIQNAIVGEYTSPWMCYFQSWYALFGVSGSAWMNAVLANEIYKMLYEGQNFRRYQSPTTKQITIKSCSVLVLSAFISSWGSFQTENLPHSTVLFGGVGCFPQDYDLGTSLFFYLIFFPLLIGIPMIYVIFLTYRIYHHQMIPKQGRRKMLATFFLRLVAIYLIMWVPALVLTSILNPYVGPWGEWAGGAWGHLQGVVSASFILHSKPDIRYAVKQLLCCKCKPLDSPPIPAADTRRRSRSLSSRRRRNNNNNNNNKRQQMSQDTRLASSLDDDNKSGSRKSVTMKSLRSSFLWLTPSKLMSKRDVKDKSNKQTEYPLSDLELHHQNNDEHKLQGDDDDHHHHASLSNRDNDECDDDDDDDNVNVNDNDNCHLDMAFGFDSTDDVISIDDNHEFDNLDDEEKSPPPPSA